MDPFAPINGISLERYAELAAEIDGLTDPADQTAKVTTLGVAEADWEAATAGWIARMQDMSLMGAVATRYMPLYQAALAKKGGGKTVTFEEYCSMSAMIQVFGPEGMMGHYQISSGDWTGIASHWQGQIGADPMNLAVRKNQLQAEEAARIQGGGQPMPITFGAAATPAPGAAPAAPANFGMTPQMQQMINQQVQQSHVHQAAAAPYLAQMANNPAAAGAMQAAAMMGIAGAGQAIAAAAPAATPAGQAHSYAAGQQVLCQWSDGNRYPVTVVQAAPEQTMIALQDGRQMWIANNLLSPS